MIQAQNRFSSDKEIILVKWILKYEVLNCFSYYVQWNDATGGIWIVYIRIGLEKCDNLFILYLSTTTMHYQHFNVSIHKAELTTQSSLQGDKSLFFQVFGFLLQVGEGLD